MGAVGFEPTKAEPSDLQSDPFDHFGTRPDLVVRGEDYARFSRNINVRHAAKVRPGVDRE